MKKIGWVLACLLVSGLGSRAMAQESDAQTLGSNWDLRAGVYVPETASARNAEGDTCFAFGVEHTVLEQGAWAGTISVDYYGAGKIYNVPIQLNARSTSGRLHYGLGVGAGMGKDQVHSTTNLSYNLMVGYVLKKAPAPMTVDLRYLGTGTGKQLNGWSLTVGMHF